MASICSFPRPSISFNMLVTRSTIWPEYACSQIRNMASLRLLAGLQYGFNMLALTFTNWPQYACSHVHHIALICLLLHPWEGLNTLVPVSAKKLCSIHLYLRLPVRKLCLIHLSFCLSARKLCSTHLHLRPRKNFDTFVSASVRSKNNDLIVI